MSKSRKPRRAYDSPEATKAALRNGFNAIWDQQVEVVDPPKTIYQYRTEDVFQRILRSGNLWASDVLRMNDPKEIIYPFADIISPLVSERENGEDKYFLEAVGPPELIRTVFGAFCAHIACFSSTADLPSQWRKYADCSGYAIGFDRAALQHWCSDRGIPLFPMGYGSAHQTAMMRRFLELEKQVEISRCASRVARLKVRMEAQKYLASLAMALKDPQWCDEQEWRILIIQLNDGTKYTRLTRADGVCYFELPLVVPELVAEIVLGPRCQTDIVGLRSRLTDAGLNATTIRQAECECGDPG